ncbi:hypothetical protein GSI_11102 [Ganoderma sinense ZZ0214-1]|uniref:Uncharacterized protein n=1 Tax=Ganoderma sinense ZZ0214-1 TaxID=1077348 RepID=A0A2G8RZV5_9APHY|nr:hypothetical protein GSI_11102 [Ganoderma sinense ZZ0214-1]
MIQMRVAAFVRVLGSVAGVGAAMAELHENISPSGIAQQAAQALIQEGLYSPAARIQAHVRQLEPDSEEDPQQAVDELEVEDAVTMVDEESPYQESLEYYPPDGGPMEHLPTVPWVPWTSLINWKRS